MKDIMKKIDKNNMLLTILFKSAIYICWYLFAISFLVFINDSLSESNLVLLVISLIFIYALRVALKYFYKNLAGKNYYSIKHTIEMDYFKKLKYINYEKVEEMDKKELGNKIIEVAYNYTRIISDIGEYIIPAIIGCFIFLFVILDVSYFLSIIFIIGIVAILYIRYSFLKEEDNVSVSNYNDLLKDFVSKMTTIKKLNIFDFAIKKLEKNNDNDICILKHNELVSDIKFSNLLFGLYIIMIVGVFICINLTANKLSLIVFITIMMIKLHKVLYEVSPAIKNMKNACVNKALLDKYYSDMDEVSIATDWKKVSIKEGILKYNNIDFQVKIPDFELVKGDKVSIMGKSGEGKSSILNALSGIFKLKQGHQYIDGKETSAILDAVYISKKTELFNISLRDNLKMDYSISDEDVVSLIKEMGLIAWYDTLKDGLDTIINPKYIDIQDSVLKRLNLIRGKIMDKDVYFLDEPTYDLNIDEEKIVAKFIRKYFKNKTCIIVTHRPLLTTICDKHYFMKNHTLSEKEPLL